MLGYAWYLLYFFLFYFILFYFILFYFNILFIYFFSSTYPPRDHPPAPVSTPLFSPSMPNKNFLCATALPHFPHTTWCNTSSSHRPIMINNLQPPHCDAMSRLDLSWIVGPTILKALMPITFSSPRAQPEVVYFLVSNESPYFSNCKSEISPSNSL